MSNSVLFSPSQLEQQVHQECRNTISQVVKEEWSALSRQASLPEQPSKLLKVTAKTALPDYIQIVLPPSVSTGHLFYKQ